MANILERITNLFFPSKVVDDENFNSIDTSDHGDYVVISKKGVPSLTLEDETVNNENVPNPDLEEDFEIIDANINPPDAQKRSFLSSNYEINGYVAEIAGFNQEKLLEMCTFSKMTHCSNDKKLSKKGYKTRDELFSEGYRVTSFHYSNGRSAGLIFKKGKEVTIAYCGSRSFGDLITGCNISPTVPSFLLDEYGKVYGRVHRGFYNAFQDSFDELESDLEHYAEAQGTAVKDLTINITGHSKGGALAKLATLCLNKTKDAQNIHVATFGDPRVFDLAASEIYNEALGDKTIRVTQHRQDLVPALAPGCVGYVHVGAQLRVEIPQNHGAHRIDGYYEGIKQIKEGDFKSNNGVSLFYYPVRGLNILNSAILGGAHRAIVNFFGYQFSNPVEQKWYKDAVAVSLKKAKQQPNTEINPDQVSQVIEEGIYL